MIKVMQNGLGYVSSIAVSEMMDLADQIGLDSEVFIQVVRECGGMGNSAFFERYAASIAGLEQTKTGKLQIAAKDIGILSELFAKNRMHSQIVDITKGYYEEASNNGMGARPMYDISKVASSNLRKKRKAPGRN